MNLGAMESKEKQGKVFQQHEKISSYMDKELEADSCTRKL
jgi:hypothetical protein